MLSVKLKILLFLSLFVIVEIVSTTGLAQEINHYHEDEGVSEWGEEVTEEILGWRRLTAEVQQAIDALPGSPIENLPIPVAGVSATELVPNFGHSRGNGTRIHEGLDIMASRGTPVLSPTEAVVIRTGRGESAGLYIYTAAPGDETFAYMHLDKIAPGISTGTLLASGQVLGYVGNTGNASGGPAHLHFEIRTKNGPIDPLPRLTMVFPSDILLSTVSQISSSGSDLDIGRRGADVIKLQQFLIAQNTGQAAKRLRDTGATGYFGSVTQNALKEFQLSVGIKPASGYYGPITRAFIASGEGQTTDSKTVFNRDLTIGTIGEDVRALQKYLNENNYLITQTGPGSPGNETNYFGSLTQRALRLFQVEHNISPALGYFGPITLAFINSR